MKIGSVTIPLAYIIAAALVFILSSFVWINDLSHPEHEDGGYTLVIKKGMSARSIGEKLEADGIIRSSLYFRLLSKTLKVTHRFKAGKHVIKNVGSVTGLIMLLANNPPLTPDMVITIFEGLNIKEIASLLKVADIDSAEFVKAATDTDLVKAYGIPNKNFEGYLYPDTYLVIPGTTSEEMVKRMVKRFHKIYSDMGGRAQDMGMTMNEVITLASIIETETSLDSERAVISQIFHKRLKIDIPLQANPTIQYALGAKRRLVESDLRIRSRYNTYRYKGLPPGPIGSPGRKSIKAALWPAKTNYLYFVANGNGGHYFSENHQDHINAVNRYRKLRDMNQSPGG